MAQITKVVDYGKLMAELKEVLGSDTSRWTLAGEEVKQPDGSIAHKVKITTSDPAVNLAKAQKVLNAHGEPTVEKPSKKKMAK